MLIRSLLALYSTTNYTNNRKMTVTSDLRPLSPPLPPAFLSNPDLTKIMYISAHKSCPELQAESVISSDEEDNGGLSDVDGVRDIEKVEERSRFEVLEVHDENGMNQVDGAFSMDCDEDCHDVGMISRGTTPELVVEKIDMEEKTTTSAVNIPPICSDCSRSTEQVMSKSAPSRIPSVVASPPSSLPSSLPTNASPNIANRRKLQWEFKGLTLWLELEEFNSDLTKAVEDFSSKHSSPWIPQPHTTAIYGMEHLSHVEASRRLHKVKDVLVNGVWPAFAKPTGVTSDIAVCGRPGQVCSIAWSELTLASNDEHEVALDALYSLFYDEDEESLDYSLDTDDSSSCNDTEEEGKPSLSRPQRAVEMPTRSRPWTPHNSIAYDNPETNALTLLDTITYMSIHPTLLGCERRVKAISLWNTVGKMEEWKCIDRVKFF